MHPNILNRNQLLIIKKLELPQAPGFYLAGGTALALQIGHRTSIDFDFYSQKGFASPADIAAMKLAAIVQRGQKRDFIDIYFLLNIFTFPQLINLAIKKYPGYHPMLILRSLIYFEDAEKEKSPRPLKVLDPNFSWSKAKEKIFAEVKKYQLSMIKRK